MLIVLSGKAGSGKDAVAQALANQHGYITYSLSAPLKRFAEDMFGFSDTQLCGPSRHRNEPDPRWARPCTTCGGMGKVYGTQIPHGPCEGTGKINDNSPRRILQTLGDEWIRQMIHPDALTMRARPELADLLADDCSVVVNDARFANDRDNLRAWLGAHRVDVRAPGKQVKPAAWRGHGSELSRPTDDEVEYVLVNPEEFPFPGLKARVDTMLRALSAK
jgi:hypothetical protein